jgi:hypothetical protein
MPRRLVRSRTTRYHVGLWLAGEAFEIAAVGMELKGRPRRLAAAACQRDDVVARRAGVLGGLLLGSLERRSRDLVEPGDWRSEK